MLTRFHRALRHLTSKIEAVVAPRRYKERHELDYWKRRKADEGDLGNSHYEEFYTTHFGLTKEWYEGKRVLDIGCGPRGSLEWCKGAERRIGLDPLAEEYKQLGAASHQMEYTAAPSEAIPFPDDFFDVVASFNSLDHVDDLHRTILEIKRVLRPGGYFLLLTELGHEPTACEPQAFDWKIVELFRPELEPEREIHAEKTAPGIYTSLRNGVAYDHANPRKRYGILSVRFVKRAQVPPV